MARLKADLTQRELASRLGVTPQAISAYETGRKDPTLATLQRLVNAAGYELRVHLEPSDDHDRSIEQYLESLPSSERIVLEKEQRARASGARLRSVRGR